MSIINKKVGLLVAGYRYYRDAIPASCIIMICNPINTIIKNVSIYLQILKSGKYGYQKQYNGEVCLLIDTLVDWVELFTRPIYKCTMIESLQY